MGLNTGLVLFTALVALLVPLARTSPHLPSRRVRWYVNGDVDANVAFARRTRALTGFFLCCGIIKVDAEGQASISKGYATPQDLAKAVSAMRHALDDKELTVHAVFSVDESAIKSGRASAAARNLANITVAAGLDGLLCDYEPADSYTKEHAVAYATFLEAVAQELLKMDDRQLGLNVAGWGILGGETFFPIYANTSVSFATSMTPTYNAKNVTNDRVFTKQLVEHFGERASIGIGSIPKKGNESKCSNMPPYMWTNASLAPFLQYATNDAGVRGVDVWRCDIDHYGATAEWFIEDIAKVLNQ